MNNICKRILQLIFIYIFSGTVYVIIEFLYRGYSFLSMFFLAGFCGIFLFLLNNVFTYEMDFILQLIISSIVCTFFEYCTGMLINQDFTIWDYRGLVGTFGNDQVNIFFSLAWMLIALFGIPILDYIDWHYFGYKPETKPYYVICGKKIYFY